MFMQIFIPLRLFALQGRYMSKVCSVRKSSGAPLPIFGGKSFCLPFPWRQSGVCYYHWQLSVINNPLEFKYRVPMVVQR